MMEQLNRTKYFNLSQIESFLESFNKSYSGEDMRQCLYVLYNRNQSFANEFITKLQNNSSNIGNQTCLDLLSSFKLNDATDQQSNNNENSWLTVCLYVCYSLICLFGICGNAMVCFAVTRNPTMHTVTNLFITNLAISDILLCVFAVPFTPLYLLAYKSWVFGTVLCHLLPFAQGVSIYISTFTMVSIAVDRYIVILYPFKSRMQIKTSLIVIIAIWFATSVLTLPYAHFMEMELIKSKVAKSTTVELVNVYYCYENWPDEMSRNTFAISTTVLQFVIPTIIITFCYWRVCGKLWHRAKTIPGSVSTRREEQERERTKKTTCMLILMVCIFVVCWLPLNIHNLLIDFSSNYSNDQAIFLIVHAVAMSSTCYNPLLYAWMNENFRKEFKEILPRCAKLKRSLINSTLVELVQSHSKRTPNRSFANQTSKRCVKLHLTQKETKGENSCIEFGSILHTTRTPLPESPEIGAHEKLNCKSPLVVDFHDVSNNWKNNQFNRSNQMALTIPKCSKSNSEKVN